MSHRSINLHLFFATVAATALGGCSNSEVADVNAKSAAIDDTSPLIKGGKEQPPVKVRGKTLSAREAAGIGR